jgi:hypothetical protein
MSGLYAFWGFTTIYLFWAALIRATSEWGGAVFQGRAFGWLEGGRGGVAALLATFAFLLFSRAGNIRLVILVTSIWTFLCSIMVWVFIPKRIPEKSNAPIQERIRSIYSLVRMRNTWLLSVIIICAYSGYKITDDFSLFAREELGFTEASAAGVGTAALWIRALVAVMAGYLADRYTRTNVITICFTITVLGGLLLGFNIQDGITGLILLNLAFTAAGIYGIRALYFAVLKEAGFPVALTGTAVGIVSFVGYTPEVFMSSWMGRLLDNSPGPTGHQHVFLLLSAFAVLGLLASLLFQRSSVS